MCWCSSHVDITSVQALNDTRDVIERWADHPVEFHFATILSPWIRRSLVAGGFGYERGSRPVRSHDVAPLGSSSTDPEAREISSSDPSYGAIEHGEASTVPVDTPFFHLDLTEAVAAAEAGISKHSPKLSRSPTKEDHF
jgi:sodium-independent sulfate anion transporter 11